MAKYFTEAEEDITMKVEEEPEDIEVSADYSDVNTNPVDEAKKDPNTICVGAKCCDGVQEFYVDASDVAKYADLHEESILEALNDIIACNEEAGITADNIVVVVDESTACYVRNLEKNGAACVSYVNEAGVDDITVDVQVGPEKDEEVVKADPQEANPVDAVKRQYDSVVVAKQGDNFFMDVEDVQKCAELNCESVIHTLNGIISAHEDYDMTADNITLIVNENTDIAIISVLENANVNFLQKQE